MSKFSNELQRTIEARKTTQAALAASTGVSQGQMSRYVNGENRPDLDFVIKLLKEFELPDQLLLNAAYAEDNIVPELRSQLSVVPRDNRSTRVMERAETEAGPAFRRRMPDPLRLAHDRLGRVAVEDPKVARTLIHLASLFPDR